MNIPAKETIYNDLRFRSRAEARWAVFFDSLGVEYMYEPYNFGFTDFAGDKYGYVPDFYLPRYEKYIEVKGTDDALKKDWYKIAGCIDYHNSDISEKGLIILGDIPQYSMFGFGKLPYYTHLSWNKGVAVEPAIFFSNPKVDTSFGWSIRNFKIIVGAKNIFDTIYEPGFCYDNRMTVVDAFSEDKPTEATVVVNFTYPNVRSWNFETGYMAKAYKRARFARFEHGETPKPIPIWDLKEGES